MKKEYVVYKTTYSGSLLPKYYIGSTTIEKALSGKYFGSVKSKKYEKIFKSELNKNKHLFSIEIISYHKTRKEALTEELKLQILYNVVVSTDYINESLARKNGYFGMILKGPEHPNYKNNRRTGKKHSEETKNKISNSHIGMTYSDETKNKLSKIAKQRVINGVSNPPPPPMYGKENPMFGKPRSVEDKEKISKSLKGKNNNPKSYIIKKYDLNNNLLSTYKGFGEAEIKNNINRGILSYRFLKKNNNFKYNDFIWNITSP